MRSEIALPLNLNSDQTESYFLYTPVPRRPPSSLVSIQGLLQFAPLPSLVFIQGLCFGVHISSLVFIWGLQPKYVVLPEFIASID